MGRPKLQTVTSVGGGVLGLLAATALLSLVWLTSELRDGTRLIARNSDSVEVTEDMEIALLGYSRAANLVIATGDPGQATRRDALETELEALSARADELTGRDRDEAAYVAAVRRAIGRHVSVRKRTEEATSSLPELVRTVRPSLDAALAAISELRMHNEAQMQRAQADAEAWGRIAEAIGATIAALVLLFILGVLLGVRRYVVIPLRDIRETIARWQAGASPAGAPEEGLRETVEIAHAFNEMSAELARHREAQLTFLAGVAHDLRNPLSALSMAVETMRARPDGAALDTGDVLALIGRQVTRLNRMVGDLLDATRIEAGRLELELERLDLREPVREVGKLYAPVSAIHRVQVSVPSGPIWASADPLRIEQVVSNLVSNAIKYSPDGGEVRLELEAHGEEAWIAVTDEGRGIPEDELDSIFEPFRRLAQTKGVTAGAGLGLSVVRRIVQAHGGDIDVRSEAGRGATFRVRLPLAVVDPKSLAFDG